MRTYGIERERFFVNASGTIVPAIGIVLPRAHELARAQGLDEFRFTYELFGGQVEDRTPVCADLAQVKQTLTENDLLLIRAAQENGYSFDYSEFADAERISDLVVNPFDARHASIWTTLTPERRVAASVVAAVHVHLSVQEAEVVPILNHCRREVIEELITLGDHSGRKRITGYCAMAQTDGVPPIFTTFDQVMAYVTEKGGEKNVWDLVRFKPSTQTVEFRMFGTTPDIEEICGYVRACRAVIDSALS